MSFGCKHYKSATKLLTPCCNKLYVCRLCHNDEEEHMVDVKKVRALVCLQCNTKQEVRTHCSYCDIRFGEYICLQCKIFDEDKQQYHCNGCGICRVGPRQAFFHCDTCNLCLNRVLLERHVCIENVSRDNCSVCTEDLHTSKDELALLECGHFLHKTCFKQLEENKVEACPVCRNQLDLNNVIAEIQANVVNYETN